MNCIIGQSGGPTSVINSSLAGAISRAVEEGFEHIYGSLNGIEGIINNRIVEVDKEKFINNGIVEKLMRRPSSILGSCRFKLPDDLKDDIYRQIFETLEKLKISSFLYIGGNDSMDTVMKLNKYMKANDIKGINVVGIPKTIDNDLFEMDHSPGYPSAAKFIISSLKTIRADADIYDLKSVTLVEIMGRNAGWLAASSLVANSLSSQKVVDLLLLNELTKSKEEIIQDIIEAQKKQNNLIIAVAEGFMDSDHYFERKVEKSFDGGFEHPQVAGIAQKLADYINVKLGIKTRAIELNVIQRSNFFISKTDSIEAFELGRKALEISMYESNLVPIIKRFSSDPYSIFYDKVSPSSIANKEKFIPKDWLKDKKILQDKMTEYLLPLLEGEIEQSFENGILQFVDLDEFTKLK